MSTEFILRLVGMVVFGVGGLYLGVLLANSASIPTDQVPVWAGGFGAVGVLVGLIITPYITTRPARWARNAIGEMPTKVLVGAMAGLVVGLGVAALLSVPLSLLPDPLGQVLPFVGVIICSWLSISIFVMRRHDLFSFLRDQIPEARSDDNSVYVEPRSVLLDTSVLIDGRIADISKTGFVSGTMMVPRFILSELQHIADSPDILRRNRGRRGLDIVNRLQKESVVPVRVTDMNVEGVREADDKLVILAKQTQSAILTTDYNLNKVAGIQGVTVLNINDLANAVKAIVLPGEGMTVKVIQEGKEIGQGVGYLDDGTMVVVEDGRRLMNQTIGVVVTKVLQTAAGRMIFARPERL